MNTKGNFKPLTEEQWHALVKAYRELGVNHSGAARLAGCDRSTAAKAYEQGLVRPLCARISIKALFDEERNAARAQRAAIERDVAVKEAERRLIEREESLKAREEEATGTRQLRKVATNYAVVAGRAVFLSNGLINEMQARVNANVAQLTMTDLRTMVGTASIVVQRSLQVMRIALEIERMRTGKPIEILGVQVDKMTPDQIVEQLESMAKTYERAQGIAERDKLEQDLENDLRNKN
jgi:hypothetical protein